MDEELPAVDEVRILRLRPGDTVVVTLDRDHVLDDHEHAVLTERLQKRFPDHQVLVLSGAKLEVLRAGEVAE